MFCYSRSTVYLKARYQLVHPQVVASSSYNFCLFLGAQDKKTPRTWWAPNLSISTTTASLSTRDSLAVPPMCSVSFLATVCHIFALSELTNDINTTSVSIVEGKQGANTCACIKINAAKRASCGGTCLVPKMCHQSCAITRCLYQED